MKPLLWETRDNRSLEALGRASVQIVHDLKNQLNGLKLYATFLRKRLEKNDGAADELETIKKLIAGLDRTAADLSLIVQFGEPLVLKKQAGTDLHKVLNEVAKNLNESPRVSGALAGPVVIDAEPSGTLPLVGEFDSAVLAEALKSISVGAMKLLANKAPDDSLHISLRSDAGKDGVIEWRGFESLDHDPFHSFKGSDEIRMSLAAKVVEAHGGSAERQDGALRVRLPLAK